MIRALPVRRLFYKEETGYTVMVYQTEDAVPAEAICDMYGGKHCFKAVGSRLPDADELTVELEGEWEKSSYGWQLKVENFQTVLPKTRDGMIGYLASGLVKGIGPVIAVRIVDRFGEDTFRVMEQEPQRLLEIRGISENKLTEIKESFLESCQVRELMSYLAPFSVTPNKVKKIQDHFGAQAVSILKENPYRLTEISGMGFLTVDPIARRVCQLEKDHPYRLCAGIRHVMQQSETEGHLFLETSEVVQRTENLFFHLDGAADSIAIKRAGNVMVKNGELCADSRVIYLSGHLKEEQNAAKHLVRLLAANCPSVDVTDRIAVAEKKDGLRLGEKQKAAVLNAFCYPVSIITGGPGRGKTTVLKTILRIYKALFPEKDVLLCAPTGRAGRRMAESTGHTAMTIHKALYLSDDVEESRSEELIGEDFVIVDETTMVDMHLAAILFSRIRSGCRLLLVGDADQLPSVGPGSVFRELIASGVIPVTVLDVSYRQAGDSRIISNAEQINAGKTDLTFGEDFKFIRAADAREAAAAIRKLYLQLMDGKNDPDYVQVLSPVKKQDSIGVYALNEMLRQIMNPPGTGERIMQYKTVTYRIGDKVMQVKNRDEISNGDVGQVEDIWNNEDGRPVMSVRYSEGRGQKYLEEDLELLTHAYCTTVHKDQGNEHPVVIMPVLPCFRRMLKRNVLYTGVTRAKKAVYLVGSTGALVQAVHCNDAEKRNTLLAKRLRDEMEQKKKEAESDRAA